MAERRIALVLFVAIVAAVISPTFDLLPTTLRIHPPLHQSAFTGQIVPAAHLQALFQNTHRTRSAESEEMRSTCILSLDCVRLC